MDSCLAGNNRSPYNCVGEMEGEARLGAKLVPAKGGNLDHTDDTTTGSEARSTTHDDDGQYSTHAL